MTGGPDPENRGPMRWDLLTPENPELVWTKKLISLRKENRALRIGDFRLIEAERLLAFERFTDRALETLVVLANPSSQVVTEKVMIPDADLMDDTPLFDLLGPADAAPATIIEAAFLTVTLPPETVFVLAPRERDLGGYSRYKRIG